MSIAASAWSWYKKLWIWRGVLICGATWNVAYGEMSSGYSAKGLIDIVEQFVKLLPKNIIIMAVGSLYLKHFFCKKK